MADFIRVENGRFFRGNAPYRFLGANIWYAMNLASLGEGGDRERLKRELRHLKSLGLTNLRIMAASEGPDTEPWRSSPSLQMAPGQYNPELLDGLDFVLAEMGALGMEAVVCLGNFWNWSGGMAQYLAWAEGGTIPYPPPAEGGTWGEFQDYVGRFYLNDTARKWYADHMAFIVNRVNAITGVAYKNDPTIMSWQLANEPRGNKHADIFNAWIAESARLIKSLDSNHLVSTGCEGETPMPAYAGLDFQRNHAYADIDYMTAHMWLQNWDWFNPEKPETFQPALQQGMAYIEDHVSKARQTGKPLVLEEFGLARDGNSYNPADPCTFKNRYYQKVFETVYALSEQPENTICGVNFWAWGGEGRPDWQGDCIWRPGKDFLGDPAHEFQGWYSVYNSDTETCALLGEWAEKFAG